MHCLKKLQKTVFGLSLFLVGCQAPYSTNNSEQYLQSKNGKNLVIPPPLSADMVSHFYDLPQPVGSPVVSIKPPR